ncbi:hypothetical protein HN748_01645 [Candidatus Peregrinibacteria bacterium]|jgi:hypothetical protein|nr:hypothetical protein [Candidatus Peregrinibacteria bacterium]MBT7484163.1 hypothetical protein [Candidatus Peregrinibacteria bacterium]MBT7702915.1 hypothetical protein [Candidatus Peregrinibacteria bacterium]
MATSQAHNSSQDDTQKRVKHIFGDPRQQMNELVNTSVAIQSLPQGLQGKLVKALAVMPEEKQIQAVQALQKEQGAYMDTAIRNQAMGRQALHKLKLLKKKYKRKKRELLEKYEKREAEKKTTQALNQNRHV